DDVTAREGTPPTIHHYLEQVSLVAPADQEGKGVTLMTVHAAKGLEYPVVFVTGLEDGVFPSLRNGEDEDALAEERRLAYVAITRAEERLFLTNARARRLFGQDARPFRESRFLGDIPDHCIARPINQPRQRPSWMDRDRALRGAGVKGLRTRIHALWKELLHEHTAPSRLGVAVLVGCIVGCTPLFGLHFFVCLALAYALRLNKLVVYGAANLSIPPMVPL